MFRRLNKITITPATERRVACLEGRSITYTLKRSSRRRSIGLQIDERGLTVSVPMRSSEKWLDNVLREKARWVVTRLDGWSLVSRPPQASWADGETIRYLGTSIGLRVVPSLFVTPAHLKGNLLWIFVLDGSSPAEVEGATSSWYRQEAERLFAERVAHYAGLLDVAPRALKLSSAKTQWGCCTAKGVVLLNLSLIRLPLRLIDYVVVHELAHLREMNHSPRFWDVVEIACPDYAELRRELKAVSLGIN